MFMPAELGHLDSKGQGNKETISSQEKTKLETKENMELLPQARAWIILPQSSTRERRFRL
jgi:hypothetical protein